MIAFLLAAIVGLLAGILWVQVQIREGVADLVWHPLGGQTPHPAPGDDVGGTSATWPDPEGS